MQVVVVVMRLQKLQLFLSGSGLKCAMVVVVVGVCGWWLLSPPPYLQEACC